MDCEMAMKTVIMATNPNCSGSSKRARITATKN